MSSGWKYFALSQNPPVSIYDRFHLLSYYAAHSEAWIPVLNNLILGIKKLLLGCPSKLSPLQAEEALFPQSFHTDWVPRL